MKIRDWKTDVDIDTVKRQLRAGRKCVVCNAVLSTLNEGTRCWSHQSELHFQSYNDKLKGRMAYV